jgi:hypothetical protein
MIYRSKKAWWSALLFVGPSLVGIIGGVAAFCVSIVMLMGTAPDRVPVSLTIAGMGLFGIAAGALLLWIYLSASFEITAEELVVRFGPFRLRFRLSWIAEVIPTRPPRGVALNFVTSWDMVYIRFRKGSLPLRISPANKTEFLRELAERVPGLRGLGDGTQEDSTRLER